jgi:stage III sporulation protein AD
MGQELIQICGLCILCAVATLILRGKGGELSALVRVGGLVLTMGLLLLGVRDHIAALGALLSDSALSGYAEVMLKGIGIAVLCATCGDICRECGAQALASCVELAGNLLMLSMCVPIIREILGYATTLLEMG